ncbi:MAG: hypothetical protein WCB18_05470 [Thermoplasmata archaeon]
MDQDRLGFLFGVFAGVLLFLGALVTLAGGLASLLRQGLSAHLLVNTTTGIVLEVVIGLLFIFFAAFATRRTGTYTQKGEFVRTGDYSLAGGVILIILAIGTWYVLGLHLFEALAGIFGLIGGILLVLARRY